MSRSREVEPSPNVLWRRGTVVAARDAVRGCLGCSACDMKASTAIVEPRLLRGLAFDSPLFHACIARLSVHRICRTGRLKASDNFITPPEETEHGTRPGGWSPGGVPGGVGSKNRGACTRIQRGVYRLYTSYSKLYFLIYKVFKLI